MLATAPSPLDDEQAELEALGETIASFAARIDAAEHALLTHLREFDAREGWGLQGAKSCAHWLSWRTSMALSAARERVRVARALGDLPLIDDALRRGRLSYSKVRAVCRVATPQTERELLEVAEHATAAQVELICRGLRSVATDAWGRERPPPPRYVRRRDTHHGMVRIEMQLSPEEAAVVWEAIADATEPPGSAAHASAETPSRNTVANASAEAPAGNTAANVSAEAPLAPESANDAEAAEQRRADAAVAVARSYLQGRRRSAGSSLSLVLMTTPARLQGDADTLGGMLGDGTPLTVATARLLACDCSMLSVHAGPGGEVLDIGRKSRRIPAAIRRGLMLRDGGCAFPGCPCVRHVDAHHVAHWADGGGTAIDNLVLMCRAHHRVVHDGAFDVELVGGRPRFRRSDGVILPAVPRPAATGNDLVDLDRFLGRREPPFDPRAVVPHWDGSWLDLDHAVLSLLPLPDGDNTA